MEILSVRGVLPEHTYPQGEITDAFSTVIARGGLDERLPNPVPSPSAASSEQ